MKGQKSMLTIKEPIKLYSLNPLDIDVYSFAEKIKGNYSLFLLKIDGEELLHMTMSPPEIYIAKGGETRITNQYMMNWNEIRVSAVNHFLNRIQYICSGQLTYQDEIYISMMLRKLGIQNVQEFTDRVRKQLKRNELQAHLRSAYLENGRMLQTIVKFFQKAEIPDSGKTDIGKQETRRYYIHHKIYERLWTAELNNLVYAVQSNIQLHSREIMDRELLLMEKIRMADEIQLSQVKAYTAMTDYPPVHPYYNLYEVETGSKKPKDKREAAGYIAAAILSNLADLVSSKMQRAVGPGMSWLEMRNTICNSAGMVVDRIEQYHSKGAVKYSIEEQYTEQINRIYEYESALLKTFTEYGTDTAFYEPEIKETVSCYLQAETLEEQMAEAANIPDRLEPAYLEGWENDYEVIWKLQEKAIRYQELPAALNLPEELSEETQLVLQPIHSFLQEEQELVYENGTERLLRKYSQSINTADEVLEKEQADSYLKQFLDQVNEKNMEIQRKLSESQGTEEPASQVIIDRHAARTLSIRALEDQEAVLAEVLTNAVPVERTANTEMDRMLELADEETRRIYEKVLNYRIKNSDGQETEEVTADSRIQMQELLALEELDREGNRQSIQDYMEAGPETEAWQDILEKERTSWAEPHIENIQNELFTSEYRTDESLQEMEHKVLLPPNIENIQNQFMNQLLTNIQLKQENRLKDRFFTNRFESAHCLPQSRLCAKNSAEMGVIKREYSDEQAFSIEQSEFLRKMVDKEHLVQSTSNVERIQNEAAQQEFRKDKYAYAAAEYTKGQNLSIEQPEKENKRLIQTNSQVTEASGQLVQKSNQVTEASEQPVQKSSQVTEASGQLIQKSIQVTEASEQLIQKSSQVTEVSEQLIQKSSQVTEASGQLIQKSSQVTEVSEQLVQKNSQVTEENRRLAETNSRIVEESGRLAEKNRPIAEESGRLAEKNRPIVEESGQLAEKNSPMMNETEFFREMVDTEHLLQSISNAERIQSEVAQQELREDKYAYAALEHMRGQNFSIEQSETENKWLIQKSSQMTETSEQLIQKSSQMTETSEQLIQKSSQVTEASEQLMQKSSQVTEASEQLVRKNSQVTETSVQLVQKNSQVTEENRRLTETNSRIVEESGRLAEKNSPMMNETEFFREIVDKERLVQSTSNAERIQSEAAQQELREDKYAYAAAEHMKGQNFSTEQSETENKWLMQTNSQVKETSEQLVRKNSQMMEASVQLVQKNSQVTEENRRLTQKNSQLKEGPEFYREIVNKERSVQSMTDREKMQSEAAPQELRQEENRHANAEDGMKRNSRPAEMDNQAVGKTELWRELVEKERSVQNVSNINNIQRDIITKVAKTENFQQELKNTVNRETTLIHKNTANQLDEELLGQLYQNMQKTTTRENVIEQRVQQKTELPPIVTETKQDMIINSEKSISRMVQQDIQTRMNSISDQVYQKLERRLQNERRRRGY